MAAIARRVDGVLSDLLMAVMNSLGVWSASAGDRRRGLAWRDEVTARMVAAGTYRPYEELVAEAANGLGLPDTAPAELLDRWSEMERWPDAGSLARLAVPFGVVTNCSSELARGAVRRSGLRPRVILSAEEAGFYKPRVEIYRQACRQLGSAPARTLYVAGSPYDAEGARAAGLLARLVIRRRDQPPPDAAIPVANTVDELLGGVG